MDLFMTAQEIADAGKRLGLSCIPHTKRSVNRRARQLGWDGIEQFARKRCGAGGGGGMEYHTGLVARGTIPLRSTVESTAALGQFPLLLIPCFAVPMWICLHIIAIRQRNAALADYA